MDFGRITVDESLVLYLFGTPGQDRFGFMWDDLALGALGAVALVDLRRIDEVFPALDYFEKYDLPFVVGVNVFDGTSPHHLDTPRVALDVDPGVPVLYTDARAKERVKELLVALLELVLARAVARSGRHRPGGQRARATRSSCHTGPSVSTTRPSARSSRNRSKPAVNQRSWVTATTVPS
jgi:signal recognition particle receptor subunit beta